MTSAQSRKITVWHISRYFHPITAGGSERWRRYLSHINQSENNIQVHIATIQFESLPSEENIDELCIQRFPLKNNTQVELVHDVVAQFERDNNWPDIVILQSRFSLGMLYSIYKLRRHSHLILATTMATSRLWLPIYLLRRLEARLINYLFDVVLCGSQAMLQDVAQLGVNKDHIKIIPHGVDVERFHPCVSPLERDQLRKQVGVGSEEFVLLFVGHLIKRKGTHILFEAFHQLAEQYANMTLNYVGGRWEQDEKSRQFAIEFEEKVRTSRFSDRIRLIDSVPNIEDYFRMADLFVFPSTLEGMPNAVLEAMATGLPCIVTPFIGLSEELGTPDIEYKLAQRDSESLANAIRTLIDDEALRAQLGKNALANIRLNITLSSSLDKLVAILVSLGNPVS